MKDLNLEQQLIFCDKYIITPNELLLLEIILLAQEGEQPEIVYNYFNANVDARGLTRPMLERLQAVGIINKTYKIPQKGERLNIYDIPINKNVVKDFFKCSFEMWAVAREAIDKALDEMVDFRRQEGEALAMKFRGNIGRIAQLLASVEPYEKERVERIRARIVDALESQLGVEYDNNRLEQELIYYIEKLDVNEEKQRLGNHLDYFIKTMEDGQGQGKKLGFIAQEMGREINTLGSKSNHAEMQNIVVRMKDELEQIKEQVLNVM